jgi:hypothetical protein
VAELAPVLFVLLFVLVVGGAVALLVRASRRNRAARDPAARRDLARLAGARGWRFTPRHPRFVRQRFDGYPFTRGGPALDLVTGTHRDREFACFQYAPPRAMPPGEYPIQARYLRVFAVSLPEPAPHLMVTPGGAQGRQRYTTGDAEFDRAFAVGTEDEDFAGRVLTPRVRRSLLDDPPPGPVRFGGTDLVCWRPDRGGFTAAEVEPVLDRLCDLLG